MNDHGRRPSPRRRSFLQLVVLLAAWAGLSGCIGPAAIRHTRLRYNEVVRDTNDQQLLMNVVRLRYADSPVFIDLPNITSQFEMAGRGNYLGRLRPIDPGPASLGYGELSLRDTPTLSYHPREGREIAKALSDSAVARPAHRRQRRVQPRAAPALRHERHQRRAQRPRCHGPDPRASGRQLALHPGHPVARVAPGSRRHRAGVRDDRGGGELLGPDPEGRGPGTRPPQRPSR